MAAPVPRGAADGPRGHPGLPRQPLVRLAGGPHPARDPVPGHALLRRGVEQRHLLLLHAGAPRVPLRPGRRRHPPPRLARHRRHLPRPRPRRGVRRVGPPRLDQGRLRHLLRGCGHRAPRQMGLPHRAHFPRDKL